jgi:cation transport regulator ChaB
MPYSSKTELPAAVRKLPEHAQTIWMSAFNAAFRQYDGDEQKAFAVAWAAANKHKKANAPGRALREWNPPGGVLTQKFPAYP